MRRWTLLTLTAALALLAPAPMAAQDGRADASAGQLVQLARGPALSPDGKTLAFAWRGDVWLVPSGGGVAQRLTFHPGDDGQPYFSPDGAAIAFVSNRSGSAQVYVVPVGGGAPTQITWHTAGYSLYGWFPDGESLLVRRRADTYWRNGSRFFEVKRRERAAPRMLFDAYGKAGDLSPDGRRLLFTREGERWWRKGYTGSRASQIWMFDLVSGAFTQVLAGETEHRSPRWRADGAGFYFVGFADGVHALSEYSFATKQTTTLTRFPDDSVVFPAVSRDGSTLVFRQRFDLYRWRPGPGAQPEKLAIRVIDDRVQPRVERRTLKSATEVAFTLDGLEVAFIAGGDVWVMDTVLKEPVQITATPEEERSLAFAPDGSRLVFASDAGGQCDLYSAVRGDAAKYWWQNRSFPLTRLTNDADVEAGVSFAPDGSRLAFLKARGDLWTMTPDGKQQKRLLESWNSPQYDWSPDGRFLVYAVEDNDFNRDIWIAPVDGSRAPYNLSRHPDNEYGPAWSPDGKVIAFTGRRSDDETDLYYVYLTRQDDERRKRDWTLKKALEKMQKGRPAPAKPTKPKTPAAPGPDTPAPGSGRPQTQPAGSGAGTSAAPGAAPQGNKTPPVAKKPDAKKTTPVAIDFERLYERVRRISIPNSTPSGLVWSPDSKKLAFSATLNGKRGTYTVAFPEPGSPALLTSSTGSRARWLKKGNQLVWLESGTPTSHAVRGAGTSKSAYAFSCRQTVDREGKFRAAFDLAWRTMRDRYYDAELGKRNWDAVRRKYREAAAQAIDGNALAEVINLMLGELNGSHLGYYARGVPSWKPADAWTNVTPHLGLRFAGDYRGPGLKVASVIEKGPTDREDARVAPGEIVRAIDGQPVDPAMDLTQVLNGPLDREIVLTVRDAKGTDRQVAVRPIAYPQVSRLLYSQWIDETRARVKKLSDDKLGYLHIRGMNWSSFLKFEREIYAVGHGRDGLIIDVRENGGGFTADHLLTILCQPRHAITVPRGGGPGYPQGRRVYATWTKPIVVLCNQNSFSNAEIFSHAIKQLKRGRIVGVQTAGGVISTGGQSIMDLGYLRVPFRGWFTLGDGEDMERHGCVPDIAVWPQPGEMPQGVDRQLERAIEALKGDVKTWREQEAARKLKKASERK